VWNRGRLNAALGWHAPTPTQDFVRDNLLGIQGELVSLMANWRLAWRILPRYLREGHARVTPAEVAKWTSW